MASFTDEDDALLGALGVAAEPKAAPGRSAREERIIAGFEDVQRFVDQHGHPPQHGEDRDIFERLYAVRLDRLRTLDECRILLEPLDRQGLLTRAQDDQADAPDALDDDALLAQLGVGADAPADITQLRHVRSASDRKTAEDIAIRQPCEEFDRFKPLLDQVQQQIGAGLRHTRRFERKSEIVAGRFYILDGQKAYVAGMEDTFLNEQGKTDARLRVIFDNGTESNLLMRSFQRALQQDPAGRRIVDPDAGPLFPGQDGAAADGTVPDGTVPDGTVYVLRSRFDHPAVAAKRAILHKIGVTGGDVHRRVANARLDPTFLMADVDVVATYEVHGIDQVKLENMIHRIFGAVRLDIEVKDRFGQPIKPREWFLVPLPAIDEAIGKIKDRTITSHIYDPGTAKLVPE